MLLLLVTLVALGGCREEPSSDGGVIEGRAELVWSLDEGEPPDEPWFTTFYSVVVARDRIYASDGQRTTVLELNEDGGFVRTIGREGEGPGELRFASYVIAPPSGDLYVSRGPMWVFQKFTPDGEALERIDYREKVRGTGWILSSPFAIDDGQFVFSVSSPRNATEAEQLASPPLVIIRGDQWLPLGRRSIPEGADKVRRSLVKIVGQTLVSEFTRGRASVGSRSGEVVFVRNADPYTVFRFVEGQPEESFVYHVVERRGWVQRLDTPAEQFMSQYDDRRFVGDHTISSSDRQAPVRGFTFKHTVRGLARIGQRLILHVEVLSDSYADHRTEAAIDKKLFVVNLDNELLEMVVPLGIADNAVLRGALDNGNLIFATENGDPRVYAYRIGAEN